MNARRCNHKIAVISPDKATEFFHGMLADRFAILDGDLCTFEPLLVSSAMLVRIYCLLL